MKIGVDLSMWNSVSNFKKAKAYGLDFVILRSGSGKTNLDPSFESSYKEAKKAGIPVGSYWYLYAKNKNESLNEAKLFLNNVKDKYFEYPLYLDLEDPSQEKLSPIEITEIALEFLITIEEKGYYVGLYSMGSWFRNKFLLNHRYKGKCLNDFDFWVAHWTHNKNRVSSYVNSKTGMWQYTNMGNYAGIGKAGKGLDMNVAYKDYPKIIRNKNLNMPYKANLNPNLNKRNIILISKVPNVIVDKSVFFLRNLLKKDFYIVETMSGYFDYFPFRGFEIIGLGGKRKNHSSYLSKFYGGSDLEVLNQLKKDFN
ncbi:MAG: GH25 family lysozyme [Lagierella massiliensis]|nr:GH25 family lysozyme [Lagierella massiliensis]